MTGTSNTQWTNASRSSDGRWNTWSTENAWQSTSGTSASSTHQGAQQAGGSSEARQPRQVYSQEPQTKRRPSNPPHGRTAPEPPRTPTMRPAMLTPPPAAPPVSAPERTRGYYSQRMYDPDTRRMTNVLSEHTHTPNTVYGLGDSRASRNLPEGTNPAEVRYQADDRVMGHVRRAAPPLPPQPKQCPANRPASPGPRRNRSHSPAFVCSNGREYTSGADLTELLVLPTEQQRLETELGGAIGWGLAAHSRDLPLPPELTWYDHAAPKSTGHVPFGPDGESPLCSATTQRHQLLQPTVAVLLHTVYFGYVSLRSSLQQTARTLRRSLLCRLAGQRHMSTQHRLRILPP